MSEENEQLGRYELLRRIAVGGMGEIYLARAQGAGGFEKTLIIKRILPHLASDPQFVDKFLDEGRIIVNLSHGNIVPVFDMDEDDGEYYIAMEYVPGRDVRAVMKKLDDIDENIPPELACFVISEVCEGLAYAHRQTDSEGNPLKIVHRDVSPSNVLLSTEGEVKLIDFGIARAAGRRSETVSGRVQGKVCYMSPEQATGADVDQRSDIFSAGTVLYEMVTGVRPFQGDTDLESLDLVRQCEYPPPSELEEEVPTEIDTVVERSMARDPDERYDTADEMQSDLVQILYSGGETVTSRELAEYLGDLFPDGVERREFKEELSNRSGADEQSGSSENDGLGLDEALNEQLEQRRGSSPDPRGRTATLETPSHPEPTESDSTPASTHSPAQDTGPESGPSTAPDAASVETISGDSSAVPWNRVSLALLAIAALIGVAAVYLQPSESATLNIDTEPTGARILIDGAELHGMQTPANLTLKAGQHTVVVQKKGFEPRRFSVDLKSGKQTELEPTLSPLKSESTRRANARNNKRNNKDTGIDGTSTAETDVSRRKATKIAVESDPQGATLVVDGETIGRTPASVSGRPDESIALELRHENCRTLHRTIRLEEVGKNLQLELDCPTRRPTSDESQSTKPTERTLTIASTPSGASLRVDGKKVGTTPYTGTYQSDATLKVKLTKEGYQSLETSLSLPEIEDRWRGSLQKKPKGCLNFFAVRPQYNEIAIDGEWLEGRHQKLKGYQLTPGTHTIRVRNKAAGRDETFEFTVESGNDCTSLTVWDPDEGG